MNLAECRKDFPILDVKVHGKRLVYLDNAATTQKPLTVIEAVDQYYREYNANVHRAIHALGEKATQKYEEARAKVARFINAPEPANIVFLRNATEAINLVAYAWGRRELREGDEIVLTPMEHHSNLVPWLQLAKEKGVKLRYIPLKSDGTLDLAGARDLFSERTRLLSVTHVSNVLGTINPVAELGRLARGVGAVVLVDAAQSAPHMPVDVQAVDCDFMAISAHKMAGPTGIGALYGRKELLDRMEPFLGGGEMIETVSLEEATWAEVPWKFEAGTPNMAGAIGFGAAIDYLTGLGMENVRRHEEELVRYAYDRLSQVEGLEIYGPKEPRGGLVAFNLADVHPHDLSTLLDQEGVAIRAGHHCAQPLMRWLDVPATARASFFVYNTEEDVDALIKALAKAKEFFGHVLG